MPVTTYAISHKDTGSILSYCVLGDQKVTDTASSTALRDRLVGDNLVISLSTTPSPGFSFLKSDVVVDEITIDPATQSDFFQNPFSYVLSIPTGGAPGDGKVKTIGHGGTIVSLVLDTGGTLTLTLPTGLGPTTKLVGVLEGHAPVPITLNAPAATVGIPLGAATPTGAVAVMFLGQGLPSSIGMMKV
jgi:hypothetical protein